MTRQTLLGVVAVALLCYLCFSIGTCHATRDNPGQSVLEANAYKLSLSLPAKRAQHVAELLAADSARTAVGRAEEGVSVADQTLGLALDSARIVLADQRATNAELRATIAYLLPKVDTLRMSVSTYRDSVNAMQMASLRERYAAQALIAAQDSTIRAFRDLAESRKCAVGPFDCPSRKTSFLLGGAVGVVAVLLLL